MSVRSRIAGAPLPVWLLCVAGLSALLMWPLLLALEPAMSGGLFGGLVSVVLARAFDDHERRSLSGWDRARRQQVMERARRGSLPDTEEGRAALRRLVERDLRDRRGLVWAFPVATVGLVAAVMLLADDRSAAWIALTIAWFGLAGALFVRMELTDRTRRRAILAALDSG